MKPDVERPPGSFDETVIYRPLMSGDSVQSMQANASLAKVQLVAGDNPEMDAETRSLLQVRLKAAASVLFAAVGVYYLRNYFVPDPPVHAMHGIITLILGLSVFLFWMLPPLTLLQLRIGEVGLFAMTSVFLAAYEYKIVLLKAEQGSPVFELAAVKSCVLYFFAVIMLYGSFIPNTWKRAACVVTPIAMVPGIVAVMLRLRHDAVEHIAAEIVNFEQVSDHVIMLVLGVISAVYGTHVINTLRREVFKAKQFGQYHLKERLGSGGMGEVYLAEHQLLKRPCAIKLIRPGRANDPTALARFEREVRTTAKLSHWNTVDIFDYGRTEDGTFYYVMEYLPGLSLADLVKSYGPMPPSRVVHLLRQTCHALREAHGIGLIHRDIKPANIFAAKRGGVHDVAKLLDFGLVKRTKETQEQDVLVSQEGTFSGTPMYMSPEQATALEESDERSDIYSLGGTAYFLLTGRTPFEGKNSVQVMIAHARDPVVPPSKYQPDIPPELEKIVLRCLAKDPRDRFPDAESLEQALATCPGITPWTDEDASRWWHETSGALERTAR